MLSLPSLYILSVLLFVKDKYSSWYNLTETHNYGTVRGYEAYKLNLLVTQDTNVYLFQYTRKMDLITIVPSSLTPYLFGNKMKVHCTSLCRKPPVEITLANLGIV